MSHPRPSTPLPTVPPDPVAIAPPVARLIARLEGYKALLVIAASLVGVGTYSATYLGELATAAEVHQVRDSAAAQLEHAQGSTATQLGELAGQVQDLRVRSAAVDQSIADLQRDVTDLGRKADRLYDQLLEVARATGARRVPASAARGQP